MDNRREITPPTLTYEFTVRLQLTEGTTSPPFASGVRYGQVGIVSGEFWGPRLRGVVHPAGGDNPVVRPDGIAELDARYFLTVDDGTHIRIHNRGIFRMEPEVMDRITSGEDVDPSEYYIRTSPLFEAPAGPHEWLARSTFVGLGRRLPSGNEIDYFRVE